MKYTMRKSREEWAQDVGARLSAAMKKRGLTQESVAKSLSVTQAQVSRVLAGQFTERSASAKAMCALLRVTYLGGGRRGSRVPVSRRRLDRLSAVVASCSDQQVADLITALTALRRRARG